MTTANNSTTDLCEPKQTDKSFVTALRILTRRDQSEAELRRKLKKLDFSLSSIETAIEKCRGYNYIDDNRYATERARILMRTGRGVGRKILLDLRQRGIDDTVAHKALETVEKEYSSKELLQSQLNRRFPTFCYATADNRERRRIISFFQRRGFSLEQIFSTLNDDPE